MYGSPEALVRAILVNAEGCIKGYAAIGPCSLATLAPSTGVL